MQSPTLDPPPSHPPPTPSAADDAAALAAYRRDGAVHLPGFLDAKAHVAPLQEQIRTVIDLGRAEAGLPPSRGVEFDDGLADLLTADRRRASLVYDAIRKLPAFFRIANDPSVWDLVGRLMETDLPGWYAQGSGIRMDHPGEEAFLSPWHQEYPTHLNSRDMLVVWLPLVPVDAVAGPVRFCPGSHREGIMPVRVHDALNANRNGSKAMSIVGVERQLTRHPETTIDTRPGDALVLHGLTLHASSPNRSDRTRWSIQLRYLNFRDETARRIGWTGGMLAGVDLRDVHPEAVVAGTVEGSIP